MGDIIRIGLFIRETDPRRASGPSPRRGLINVPRRGGVQSIYVCSGFVAAILRSFKTLDDPIVHQATRDDG